MFGVVYFPHLVEHRGGPRNGVDLDERFRCVTQHLTGGFKPQQRYHHIDQHCDIGLEPKQRHYIIFTKCRRLVSRSLERGLIEQRYALR